MINQTRIATDKKYPDRLALSDRETSWSIEVPKYMPPIYPDFKTIQERLANEGLEINNVKTLQALAGLATRQALELYGPVLADLRHPLGRTGINGTGVFYKAGKSSTADLAVLRDHPVAGRQIALVYNRGKWRLPGGFIEPADEGDRRRTAIREGEEEINLNLEPLARTGHFCTLLPEHVKPQSSRSVDMGYVTTQVEIVMLPDYEFGDDLAPGDDAKAAEWTSVNNAILLGEEGQISPDHYSYIKEAIRWSQSTIS